VHTVAELVVQDLSGKTLPAQMKYSPLDCHQFINTYATVDPEMKPARQRILPKQFTLVGRKRKFPWNSILDTPAG